MGALQKKIDELSRVRGQTQARIAFLEGPPEQPGSRSALPAAPDDAAGARTGPSVCIASSSELEGTLFGITHEGGQRIIAEHERRIAEIEALRARDGSNAEQVDQLIAHSAAVREAQLAQLRAKEVEAAEKVRAANERVVVGLEAERAALMQTERERFVAQAMSRLSAEATEQQRREVEQLVGALFDEQQAMQARQRLMDEGRSVIDRTRTATEQHAAETLKLNELLQAGAIDQATYARAVEDANDRALRSSQAWTDGATRFLKDYVAESNDAATATERAFANAFSGAEDSLVGFISSGKLEFQGLAESILADLARTTVREHQRCVRHLPLGLGLLHQPGLQRRHRPDPVLRRLLDGPHGPPVGRRPLRLPAPLERGACAHGQCATRHAPRDRHRRGHLPDGVASNAFSLSKLSRDRLQGAHPDLVRVVERAK